jgi:hypothetical protein
MWLENGFLPVITKRCSGMLRVVIVTTIGHGVIGPSAITPFSIVQPHTLNYYHNKRNKRIISI